MIRRIRVGAHERAFAWKSGPTCLDLEVRYLRPGTHWLLGFGWWVQREDVRGIAPIPLSNEEIEKIERLPEAASELTIVRFAAYERAIVWIDGRMAAVLTAGPEAFFRLGRKVRVEVVSAHEAIEPELTEQALAVGRGSIRPLEVPEGGVAVLLNEGVARSELGPGCHAVFEDVPGLRVAVVRTSPRDLHVRVPEVWTRELWTSSVALTVRYRVKDARRWAESPDAQDELSLSARQVVQEAFARRTFARVARDRTETSLALEAALSAEVGDWIEVLGVGLGDVVLLRRLVRRFRGFGERGREVAVALRDFAARPRVHERRRH